MINDNSDKPVFSLDSIVIDCKDAYKLADFYCIDPEGHPFCLCKH